MICQLLAGLDLWKKNRVEVGVMWCGLLRGDTILFVVCHLLC